MSGTTTQLAAPPRAEVRIDLGAYRHNVQLLSDRLHGGAQLWAVVKANAYGHDVDRIAQEAVVAGARQLCVATLSEARHLRQSGIRVPMLVMGPLDAPSIRRAIDLDVSISVLDLGMLAALEQVVSEEQSAARRARVHLKVDTGMGRWGVRPADALGALDRLLDHGAAVEVEGLMTHFATADDEADNSFLREQLATFEPIVAAARDRVPGILVHAANSAATLAQPSTHFDAVRCGVATYGLDPMQRDASRHGLRPVLSVRSYVADVKRLEPGESTGYCRTFVAREPVLVAEVPIGYADGIRRALGNTGHALVRGAPRPVVGNVSMDHLSLLVDEHVAVGDVVTLLGSDGAHSVTAEEHAEWAGTINYEVTCAVADEPRLLRVHVGA